MTHCPFCGSPLQQLAPKLISGTVSEQASLRVSTERQATCYPPGEVGHPPLRFRWLEVATVERWAGPKPKRQRTKP